MKYYYELFLLNDIRNVEWNQTLVKNLKYCTNILKDQDFVFELHFKNRETSIYIGADNIEVLDAYATALENVYPITHQPANITVSESKHMIILQYALDPLFTLNMADLQDPIASLMLRLDQQSLNSELSYQVMLKKSARYKKNRRIFKKYVIDAYYHHRFIKINNLMFEILSLFSNAQYRTASKLEIDIGEKMLKKLRAPVFHVQIRILANENIESLLPMINMFRDPETGQSLSFKIIDHDFEHFSFYGTENMSISADELIPFLNIPVPNNLRLGYDI
ncbi:MAG: hypothetical protein ACP5NL_06440 [Thermoplasmata archaeon]